MWLLPTILTSNMEKLAALESINHSLPSRLSVPLAFKVGGGDFRSHREDSR